jgi:hypothetical protein
MPTSRYYSRSPITEAIIDFQVELPEGVVLADLERCQDAAYANKKALNVPLDRIDCAKEGSTSTTISRGLAAFRRNGFKLKVVAVEEPQSEIDLWSRNE